MSDLQPTSNLMTASIPEPTQPAIDPAPIRARIDALDLAGLEKARNEILAAANGDYESLSTEQLHAFCYISSRLRRTNVGPPKESKAAKAKPAKTVDDLL